MKIKTLTIDRKKWGRGETGGSLLDGQTKKQCCLGFFALECGFNRKNIKNVSEPQELVNRKKINKEKFDKLQPLLKKDYDHGDNIYTHSKNTGILMEVNDSIKLTDIEREEKIIKYFKKIGVKVRFIN